MISSINAVRYFKISAEHTAADEFPRNMMRFLCNCFELIAGKVEQHPVVTAGFSIANNYWNMGVGDADAVVEARIDCWNFLESEEKGSHVNQRSNATIRALLCIMYPEQVGDDDFVMELFDWFFEMADVVGDFNQSFDALFQGLKGLTPSQS
ncbi:hypothetical protein [Pseudomonas graminis]|uniref:Uncharacterized protein n=1 Tax=Pseudomonas graminis TaxID=158627 RepID=A0A1I0JSX4_9PSED|nr:hypothetical protein [Pseudomonas graminis]SEU13861.1 hypothetical protein SAMN05216197_1881 [Pseudomonas graminis]